MPSFSLFTCSFGHSPDLLRSIVQVQVARSQHGLEPRSATLSKPLALCLINYFVNDDWKV